jgi:two-component system, NarL family, sensor kinase
LTGSESGDWADDGPGDNRLLRQIIEVTSADLGLGEVAGRVAALVTEATGSEVCFVHLVDDDRGRVVLAGATPPFDELVGTIELPLGEGIAGWVALHAEPTVVPDKWADPRYRYIPALRGEDYASLVSVPMMIRGGRVVGVLNVHSKQQRRYEPRDLVLLNEVASLMARTVEHARLYQRLTEREEMLAAFAARTVEAQELERRRLAGEIHDGISQRLISLWYHLLAAEDGADEPGLVRRELAVAKEPATAALDEALPTLAGLRPSMLDDLGLGPSLDSLARSVVGPAVELDLDSCRLSPHVEVALYRIAQEALQNVVKHADASRLTMTLTSGAGGVRLVVDDNGRGFDEGSGDDLEARLCYGLVGMRERAELIGARLTVVSQAGVGTRVEVVVPEPSGAPPG